MESYIVWQLSCNAKLQLRMVGGVQQSINGSSEACAEPMRMLWELFVHLSSRRPLYRKYIHVLKYCYILNICF